MSRAIPLTRVREPTMLKYVLSLLGPVLILLGLYLAPLSAKKIQKPFQEYGEQTTAEVLEMMTAERTFNAGGRRGGTQSYNERILSVRLASTGRTVEINQLVTPQMYNAIAVGDEVDVTFIRGREATESLPHGPFYLLTDSVDAGSFKMLRWAFSGRPANGWSILTLIPGLLLLFVPFIIVSEAIHRRKQAAGAPPA